MRTSNLVSLVQDEQGQAVTEYVIVLTVVVGAYLMVFGWINRYGLADKLTAPIKNQYARAYQYGSPTALGFDDPGGPSRHPRILQDGNFRIFINPVNGSGGGGD